MKDIMKNGNVEREDEWMKEIITIKEVQERLKINCSYGWNF